MSLPIPDERKCFILSVNVFLGGDGVARSPLAQYLLAVQLRF